MKTWVLFTTLAICFCSQDSRAQLIISATTTDLSCNSASGPADGAIDLAASGGVIPYSYLWSDGSTSEDLTGLAAGSYAVTVTDASGATAEGDYELIEPTELDISAVFADPDCGNDGPSSGMIDVTVSGGTESYSYTWTGPGMSPTAEDHYELGTGTYDVTVADSNGCTVAAQYTLTEQNSVQVTGVVTDLTCNASSGPADGMINITVSGGQGRYESDYTYSWRSPAGGSGLVVTDADQTGLSSGTYTVIVTDARGCSARENWTLSEPQTLDVSLALPNAGFCSNDSPTALEGGQPAGGVYSGPGVVNNEFDPALAGAGVHVINYRYTDAAGCIGIAKDEIEVYLAEDVHLTICEEELPANFFGLVIDSVGTYETLGETEDGCSIKVVFVVNPSPMDTTIRVEVPEAELPYIWYGWELYNSGVYFSQLADVNGCVYDEILELTVTNKSGIQEVVLSEQICESDIFVCWWNPDLVFTESGTYEDIVTDSSGCTTKYILHLEVIPLAADLISDVQVCSSQLPYVSEWDPELEFEEAGNYTYSVVDDNGCPVQHILNLEVIPDNQPAPPNLCYVSYNEEAGANEIFWEDAAVGVDVLQYRVYREGLQSGQVDLVGTVAEAEENKILDPITAAQSEAYHYYVTAENFCRESEASNIHKTIHLDIAFDADVVQLNWDSYEGVAYAEVNIYKGASSDELTLWKTLPASTFEYMDMLPPVGSAYYQIEIVVEVECDFRRIVLSRSNIVAYERTSNVAELKSSVQLFPNPVSDQLVIVAEKTVLLSVKNGIGQYVSVHQLSTGRNVINSSAWDNGIYLLQFSAERGRWTEKIIVQRE